MLLFVSLTFSLFWFAYRHNYYFVQRNKIDTHGLLFNNALSQLFAGIYVCEIALIGLFFLVRDAESNVACKGQAIIMIVVLILTAIFHFVMEEHLRPLYEFIPVTLEDMAADAERNRFSIDNYGREKKASPLTDVGTSSAIELSTLGKHPSATTPNEPTSLKPETPTHGRARAITNASTLTAASARHALSTVKRRAQLSSASSASLRASPTPPSGKTAQQRREAADQLGAAIASYPDALSDLSPEERTAQLQAAFQDPVTREPRPVVWIPNDEAGMAEEIVKRVGEVYGGRMKKKDGVGKEDGEGAEGAEGEEGGEGATLVYSCEGAELLKSGKVQITRPPPDIRADWCLEWQL